MDKKFDWTGMPVPSRKAEAIAKAITYDRIGGESFLAATVFVEHMSEPYIQLQVWALVTSLLDREQPKDRAARAGALAEATAVKMFEQFRDVIEGKVYGLCTYGDRDGKIIKEAKDPPDMTDWFAPLNG